MNVTILKKDNQDTPEHFLVPAIGRTLDGIEVWMLVSKSTSVGDTVEWLGTADEYGPPKIIATAISPARYDEDGNPEYDL